ncbi:hypothetical protein ACFDAU_06300 [Sulfuriferula sp. GW1]|uniref:hypothetical protein n=1 Tax=Sulfuriferula sp. GW1 TaxID=3345111 RepID=UPI0039B05D9D
MADLPKAKKLVEKLNNGGNVSLRDLEAALGKDGVEDYENRWRYELEKRNQFSQKPEEIKQYEALVHEADFDENRANGIKGIGKRSKKDSLGRDSKKRLREQAESKYERALEYLSEILNADPSLEIWFDRKVDIDPNTSNLGTHPQGVPRTVTSRSEYKLDDGLAQKRSKADIKREALQEAIEWLERKDGAGTTRELGDEEKVLLKQKLAKLKTNDL